MHCLVVAVTFPKNRGSSRSRTPLRRAARPALHFQAEEPCRQGRQVTTAIRCESMSVRRNRLRAGMRPPTPYFRASPTREKRFLNRGGYSRREKSPKGPLGKILARAISGKHASKPETNIGAVAQIVKARNSQNYMDYRSAAEQLADLAAEADGQPKPHEFLKSKLTVMCKDLTSSDLQTLAKYSVVGISGYGDGDAGRSESGGKSRQGPRGRPEGVGLHDGSHLRLPRRRPSRRPFGAAAFPFTRREIFRHAPPGGVPLRAAWRSRSRHSMGVMSTRLHRSFTP